MEDEKLVLYDEDGNIILDDYSNDEDNEDEVETPEPQKNPLINKIKKFF